MGVDLSILTDIQRAQLKRNYEQQPLLKGEYPCKDDLYYLYIVLNLRQTEIAQCIGRNASLVSKYLKYYKIIKPQELLNKQHEETCLKHFGVSNQNLAKDVREKTKRTCLERYGTEHATQSTVVKEKYKKTCLEKYGTDSTNKVASINEKRKKTFRERYGTDCPLSASVVRKKIQETCQERYGSLSYMGTSEFLDKAKQTCIEKFGCDNSMKSPEIREKARKTNLERYGVDNASKSAEIKERIRQTCLEKYGAEHFCSSDYYDKDVVIAKRTETNLERYGCVHPIRLAQFEEKRQQTCQEKYGVSNVSQLPEVQQQIYNTKQLHGTFNSSINEQEIQRLLVAKFGIEDIRCQYTSAVYPFACDFYIVSLDLYIEYQGYWGHGFTPFDATNVEHLKKVHNWEQLAAEIDSKGKPKTQYLECIKLWTQRDPLKRETAKKNNLNWIEFFNMQEFYAWFNSLSGNC